LGDPWVLIFFYMIQSLLMVLAGLEFFNIKYKLKEIILPVLIFGFTIWLVRFLYVYCQIPFGSHTFVLFVLFCIILRLFFKTKVYIILTIALLDFILIMLGACAGGYIIHFIKIDMSITLNSTLLHILFGNTENIFLVMLFAVTKIFKVNMLTIMERIERDG
jgi:hypothetical protein